MITGINESKTLTKHILCECKCRFDGRNYNSHQWWNNNKCRCQCKKHICEKDYIWNPSTCICENGKYLASIMDDSVITFDKAIEETVPISFNQKKATYKMQNLYILLACLLITTILLVTVSIYCYLIKCQTKQKHLLPFHDTNNELKQKHSLPFHDISNGLKQVLC